MNEDKRMLGDLVRTGRLRMGLSQMQFAKKVGLSQRAVSAIERGETLQPRHDVLMQVARVLQISLSEVMHAVSRSAGNTSLDDYFNEESVPPELRVSFLSLAKLSPDRMRQAQEMIEVLAAMDDTEFQRGKN